MDIISDLTEHMGSITSQLKTFARKSDGEIEPVNMKDRITRVQFLLENQIRPAEITVKIDLCEREVFVLADPVKIDQVLINLIRNAVDSMTKTSKKQLDIRLTSNTHTAELTISDSGHGIDPKSMEQLFEPFFTTKDSGEGLGLGLSISTRIINEISGTIRATTNEYGGATFIVRLPQQQSNMKVTQ